MHGRFDRFPDVQGTPGLRIRDGQIRVGQRGHANQCSASRLRRRQPQAPRRSSCSRWPSHLPRSMPRSGMSPIDQSHCWFSRRRHCRSPWTTPRGYAWFHSMFSMPRRRPLKAEAAAFSWHFPEPAPRRVRASLPRRVRASLPLSRPFFSAAVLAWRHRGVRSRPP